MHTPSDRRCKRSAGPNKWRCSETSSPGKSYCEKHMVQLKQQTQKRNQRDGDENRDSGEILGGKGDASGSNNNNKKKMNKKEVSDGLAGEASESDSHLKQILTKEQKNNFSAYKRVKVDKGVTNSQKSLSTFNKGAGQGNSSEGNGNSGEGKSNSGEGKSNSDKGQWRPAKSESKALEKDESNKNKKGSLMCHQCQRNDKSGVVFCSNCNRKRYCYECLEKWYPGKTREEVEDACPFCCGNCNCKACLREVLVVKPCHKELDVTVKLQRLQYLLYKALPVLRCIHKEQIFELEIESNIRGVQLTEMDITRIKLDKNERLFWKIEKKRERNAGYTYADISIKEKAWSLLASVLIRRLSIKVFSVNAENTTSTGGADQVSSVLILVVARKRIYEGDWIKRYDLR